MGQSIYTPTPKETYHFNRSTGNLVTSMSLVTNAQDTVTLNSDGKIIAMSVGGDMSKEEVQSLIAKLWPQQFVSVPARRATTSDADRVYVTMFEWV